MRLGEHEAELRWYFLHAAGELGMRSNFTSIVARIEGGNGGGGTPHHVDMRRLEAAGHARRIAATLALLQKTERSVLFAAYSRDPDQRLIGVMLRMPEAKAEHRKSRSTRTLGTWLQRLCIAVQSHGEFERRRVFASIHSAADRSLQGALDAYAKHARRLLGEAAGRDGGNGKEGHGADA